MGHQMDHLHANLLPAILAGESPAEVALVANILVAKVPMAEVPSVVILAVEVQLKPLLEAPVEPTLATRLELPRLL